MSAAVCACGDDEPGRLTGANAEVLGLCGWANPQPILLTIPSADVAALREQIARDIGLLMPRCLALDAGLTPCQRGRRSYATSKQLRAAELRFVPVPATVIPTVAPAKRAPIPLAQRGARDDPRPPGDLVPTDAALLAIGSVFGAALRAVQADHPTTPLVPGEGEAVPSASGESRPPPESLSGWLALHDERERAGIAAFLLGRDTGRADVELLRGRLHGHHRVMIESGASAVPWLFALWDGSAARHGEILVFSEPGPEFRAPSLRTALADGAGWPRISIVTVSFNQRDFLEQCLTSVLDQGYPNLEYIVVDAGSTDGSIEVLERYRPRLSRLVIEPDDGQSDGLNKGFGHASGEILSWINSDDMLAPLALWRAAAAFARSGADIVAGSCSRVAGPEAALLLRHHSVLPTAAQAPLRFVSVANWCDAWEKGDFFYQPEVFFSRDIWMRAGGYLKPYLYWAMDWDLWLRFALAGATAIRIPDVLGISREHVAQKTTADETYLWQVVNILREYDQLLAQLQESPA